VTADLLASIAAYDTFIHGLPGEPELAGAHPLHEPIPPDIKHHRVPAPGLSFQVPNLPFLIREVEQERLVR